MSSTNTFDPRHPHEPDVAPVYDPEGRCLVCGCQWRDEQIAQRDAFIHELVKHLRAHNRECSLLPENTEENPGWEREAHEFITDVGLDGRREPAEPGVDTTDVTQADTSWRDLIR